jgi:hypothetical protein
MAQTSQNVKGLILIRFFTLFRVRRFHPTAVLSDLPVAAWIVSMCKNYFKLFLMVVRN